MAEVTDNQEQQRYEIHVDGELAGFTDYRRRDGRIVFTHAEVDEKFEGQGLGSDLARGALDAAREMGLPVVAQCPFIASFIERNQEFAELVAQ